MRRPMDVVMLLGGKFGRKTGEVGMGVAQKVQDCALCVTALISFVYFGQCDIWLRIRRPLLFRRLCRGYLTRQTAETDDEEDWPDRCEGRSYRAPNGECYCRYCN